MYYIIGLIWIALVIGVFWAYRRKRTRQLGDRAQKYDSFLSDFKKQSEVKSGAPDLGANPEPVAAAPLPQIAKKERLLTPVDALLYRVFRTGLPDHEIFAGLTLADVMEIAPAIKGYEREQRVRRLRQHRLDLVVCTSQLEVIAAVVVTRVGAAPLADEARYAEECLHAAGIRLVCIEGASPPRHHQVRDLVYGVAAN